MNGPATATDETTPQPTDVPELWPQSPAMERLWRALQTVIVWLSFTLATIACTKALYDLRPDLGLLGISLAALLLFPAIALHEAGHYLGARIAGMTVLKARIGRVEFSARRTGWKARWHKSPIKMSASVLAIPRIDRPFRDQMLTFVLAGPIFNLMVSACFAGLAWLWLDAPLGAAVCGSEAAINLALGIANLCPTRRTMASDGMQWRQWWRGMPDNHPHVLALRMVASGISGCTSAQQPPEFVEALSRGQPKMQLMAQWIRLKAHQERGEWRQAAELKRENDALFAKLDAKVADRLADFRWELDMESAFSRAMAGLDVDELKGIPDRKEAAWSTPSLWLRCQALLAAFEGDAVRRDQLLRESEQLANDSLDLGWSRTEAEMRRFIRGIEKAHVDEPIGHA